MGDEIRDSDRPEPAVDPIETTPTDEVGSEGGSPGDVDVEIEREPTSGAESKTTARPAGTRRFSRTDRRSP